MGGTEEVATYRCDGCGTKYHVVGEAQPTVLCPDCEQVATPHGDPTARQAYRLGYTQYLEARRRLTDALDCFEADQPTLARGGFDDAATEFERAVDQFTTAARQAASESFRDPCEQARKKSTCLWQAVEWLSGAAYADEQGETDRATEYKHDAQQRLRAAREYGSLPSPDDISVSVR